MCKILVSSHKQFISTADPEPWRTSPGENGVFIAMPPLTLIARCGRVILAKIRASHLVDDHHGYACPHMLGICATVIETEALPQASRWHRRDLAPATCTILRAVLRAIAVLVAKANETSQDSVRDCPAVPCNGPHHTSRLENKEV